MEKRRPIDKAELGTAKATIRSNTTQSGTPHSVTDPRFGVCPQCARNDGYLNIGSSHWFVCHEHKLKWCAGENLFRSWRQQTKRHWRRNWELLCSYKELLA